MNNLPINSPADAITLGEVILKSGTFGISSKEAGAVIALFCFQDNMTLLEYFRRYNTLDNKPTMRADAMLAKLLELGGAYEILERSDDKAAIRINAKGGKPYDFSLTFEQVKTAGYCYRKGSKELKPTYVTHRKNMLWARVVSDAVRTVEPRVNAGIYSPEEMEDFGGENEQLPPSDPVPKLAWNIPTPVTPPHDLVHRTPPLPADSSPAPVATPAPVTPPKPAQAATTNADDPFTAEPPVDYAIVPIGPNKGKKWSDLDHDTLNKVIANPRTLTPQHLAEVRKALDSQPY